MRATILPWAIILTQAHMTVVSLMAKGACEYSLFFISILIYIIFSIVLDNISWSDNSNITYKHNMI